MGCHLSTRSVDRLYHLECVSPIGNDVRLRIEEVYVGYNTRTVKRGPILLPSMNLEKTSAIHDSLMESLKNKDNLYSITSESKNEKRYVTNYLTSYKIVNADKMLVKVVSCSFSEHNDYKYKLKLTHDGIADGIVDHIYSNTIDSPKIYEVYWTIQDDCVLLTESSN